jgi:hypothetical protein
MICTSFFQVSHVTIYAGRDGRAVERPQATLYPVKYKVSIHDFWKKYNVILKILNKKMINMLFRLYMYNNL